MKLALLQMNPTVGAVRANADALLSAARAAHEGGAELAVAPELCLVGYPPRDLLDRPALVRAVALETARVISEAPADLTLIFGTLGSARRTEAMTEAEAKAGARAGAKAAPLTGNERFGEFLGNDAVVAQGGREIGRARKQLLPTYDVFDEARHFAPGSSTTTVDTGKGRIAVTICEDAWAKVLAPGARYTADPLRDVNEDNCDLIVNLSASPFTATKLRQRQEVFATTARAHGVPFALANQVGGNDELIFDGQSGVWGPDGSLWARAPVFEEQVLITDLGPGGSIAALPETDEEAVYAALVLGVRDYARKCGFKKAVLGLSGGIDSALVATIAADALGHDNVLGVAMPTRYSSRGSLDDAATLAKNLGTRFQVVDIDHLFAAYTDRLKAPLDEAATAQPSETTFENLQARIRAATLMAFSNRTGALLLTTGNKSELAVGYCTLYGDMAGGLAVISDLPKTLVYRVAKWINSAAGRARIPVKSITKPPSAELKPDQKDSDSLPDYDVLDRILELHVEEGLTAEEIVKECQREGFNDAVVRRVIHLVAVNEYKRRQAPPGLIVTKKAFGPGRRMPLAKGFLET